MMMKEVIESSKAGLRLVEYLWSQKRDEYVHS